MQSVTFDPYPADLSVDYDDTGRNRLTVGFRIFTVLPILIVLAVLGGSVNFGYGSFSAGGVLFLPRC